MTQRVKTWLAALLLLGSLQYFVAELIVAHAWTVAPYSWSDNFISDLGVPECYNEASVGRAVCSPLHIVMDIAFVVQGIIALLAVLLLRSSFPKKARRIILPIATLHAVGIILVGLFPGSTAEVLGGHETRTTLHITGAFLAILCGNALIVATGIAYLKTHRTFAVTSLLVGSVGVFAIIVTALQQDLGLGLGGIERLSVNPIIIWLILAGGFLVFQQIRTKNKPAAGEQKSPN